MRAPPPLPSLSPRVHLSLSLSPCSFQLPSQLPAHEVGVMRQNEASSMEGKQMGNAGGRKERVLLLLVAKAMFPIRGSNPGLSGESRLS